MNTFLKHVAKYIYEQVGEGISDVTLVFPGKRVSLFFLRYLSEIAGKPIWSPNCFTIQELMQYISGKHSSDSLQLIFELYGIYQKKTKTNEPFDNFYYWGEMLLADFDDIDKYMVNANDLFQNLAKLKQYENLYNYLSEEQIASIRQFWSSFTDISSFEIQEKFISVWSVLYPVYSHFKEHLNKNEMAYDGMIYRDVAEKLKDNHSVSLPSEKIVFVGFNALNVCEKKLFEYLRNHDRAWFLWDYDPTFLEDPVHQAGFFLRENLMQFPSPDSWKQPESGSNEKSVKIYGVGSDIAQVKQASVTIRELARERKIDEQTAWILTDETMLPQVLDALPQEINDVNITMGFPMHLSQSFGFLNALFDLHHYQRTRDNDPCFYFRQVADILQHPFIIQGHRSQVELFVSKIYKENQVYITRKDIPEVELLHTIFNVPENVFDWLREIIQSIIRNIRQQSEKTEMEILELEFLFFLYTAFNQIEEQLINKNIEVNLKTLRRMVSKVIRNFKIPFSGEPLCGLQIMGLLETRAIDFKNIVILSFNEGIYPKTSATPSYIPYNLRKGFRLPTLEHQDSIFAYYFYRLLQRAEHVEIFYNTKADGLKTGERSRFLHQMVYQGAHPVEDIPVTIPMSNYPIQPIEIEQSNDTIDKLKKYMPDNNKILSPSALNVFLDCTLKFYFRYIAEIPETEEISEEIDAAVFGNILHDSMEAIYKKHSLTIVDKATIRRYLSDDRLIAEIVESAFEENYSRNSSLFNNSGNNAIVKNVIQSYVKQILRIDAKIAPFGITELEEEHRIRMNVSTHPEVQEIVLGGKIDRVDKIGDTFRIIDYKTGNADHGFGEINQLFEKEKLNRNKAVFQTFLYSYVLSQKLEEKIQPGLYPVRNIYDENFDSKIFAKVKTGKLFVEDFAEIKQEYGRLLKETVDEIFSPDATYKQTSEYQFCQFCPYCTICRRR